MKKLSNTEAELKKSIFFFKKTCSSFLLDTDSFSFIISKRLFHTSFKVNIVNFSNGLLCSPSLNSLMESQCTQTPAAFYFLIHAKCRILANALMLLILAVEIFFEKEEKIELQSIDFENGGWDTCCTHVLGVEDNHAELVWFLFFWWQKE